MFRFEVKVAVLDLVECFKIAKIVLIFSLHCTLFRKAFILSGSCFNKSSAFAFSYFVKTQRIRNKPSNFTNFFKLSIIEYWNSQSKSAKKHYFEHVWANWLYNRKFVKLLGLFLIPCVFTKKLKVKAEDLLKQEPERIKAFWNSVHSRKKNAWVDKTSGRVNLKNCIKIAMWLPK